MTNPAAAMLVILIVIVFAADALYLDWNLPVLLGRALTRAVDWLAVWR